MGQLRHDFRACSLRFTDNDRDLGGVIARRGSRQQTTLRRRDRYVLLSWRVVLVLKNWHILGVDSSLNAYISQTVDDFPRNDRFIDLFTNNFYKSVA